MNIATVVAIDTKEGCKKAVSDLEPANQAVFEENIVNQPKGCYMYIPENKLYFNEHSTGLVKGNWKKDTRKVCRDFKDSLEKNGGKIKLILVGTLELF